MPRRLDGTKRHQVNAVSPTTLLPIRVSVAKRSLPGLQCVLQTLELRFSVLRRREKNSVPEYMSGSRNFTIRDGEAACSKRPRLQLMNRIETGTLQ